MRFRLLWSARIATANVLDVVADRDGLIEAVAPERECMDTPGLFQLPNGDRLSILARQVKYFVPLDVERCLCADPNCSCCAGKCASDATVDAYRVDMEDESGTPFCDACWNDAIESGLFRAIPRDPEAQL